MIYLYKYFIKCLVLILFLTLGSYVLCEKKDQTTSTTSSETKSVHTDTSKPISKEISNEKSKTQVSSQNTSKAQITRSEQNKIFLEKLKQVHKVDDESMKKITSIFNSSPVISQGNPNITEHPLTTKECLAKLEKNKIDYSNPKFEAICHHKYMAPLYDPETQTIDQATTCIDQFEFPSIPCEYPLVWTRASEAASICEAMGKRLCDAHEWEGACEGRLLPPDYIFSQNPSSSSIQKLRLDHNKKVAKTWGYGGSSYKNGICGGASFKSKNCNGGDWSQCGSNTYPVGSFPDCHSSLMVYDIHGNAAEHMNLPLSPEQMASHSSHQYGYTEMKGSWFIFDTYKAHPDYCRWRAPFWHGTRTLDPKSHHNYHLGFRCCLDLDKKGLEKNKDLK